MKLHIEDLPVSEELDATAMATIEGGRMKLPTHMTLDQAIAFWDIDPAFI